MRPLARKIFLTQGLVVLLVFTVSLFAYLSLQSARARASHLRAEYELGIAHETLLSELRDIQRSRAFYYLEKHNQGKQTAALRATFSDALDRVSGNVDKLESLAANRGDMQALASQLRHEYSSYLAAVKQFERTDAAQDTPGFERADKQADQARDRMIDLTRGSMHDREKIVSGVIESLRVEAQRVTAFAVVLCVLAIVFGTVTTIWLSRSIHRPVNELRLATEALSRGEFDLRLDGMGRDELGDLGRAFNEMAARLQELDEMKSHFVSVVSHELKTPLTSVRDAVELLADGVGGDLTPQQKRLISITREGMERLVNYVEGILDLSRFQAGQVQLEREPVNLGDVVEGQAELVRSECHRRNIELRLELDPDPPLIEGDRLRLGQVVANLLSNAVKFTPAGGRIEVSSLVEPLHDGLGAGIAVRDTGPGIASRDREHIFERFFQGTRADTKYVSGAGLGLAIVKNLVEAHGGTVTVKSSKGHGSTFSVLFPVAPRIESESAVAG